MKTRNIFITLLLAVLYVAPLFARQFEQGEKIYVNADQSWHDGGGNFDWSKDGAKLFLYVFKKEGNNESNQKWVTLTKENGSIYSGDIQAGEYNTCIVVRGTAANWESKWNQTGNMGFADVDRNLINKFWDGGFSADWLTYVPSVEKIATYASALSGKTETVVVCPSAMGGPFSLRVKLNNDKTEYDYESVACHGWFKSTNGTSWTSVDDYAGVARDGELDKNILKNNLPASGPVYYYLHSAKAAGRRLMKVTTEGAKDCDLDCKITSFEVACSAVNANDTTYTLDGMVAFGVPCGDLVITCAGKSTTIKAADAKSPQIFSIEGLPAAMQEGDTVMAYAKFANGSQTAEAIVKIPNATTGIRRTHIDVLVGETTPLRPEGANYNNDHFWFVDGKLMEDWQGEQTSYAFDESNVTRYTYRELKTPPDDMKDMMQNGNYETTDASTYGEKWQESKISEYEFWGKYDQTTPINFYTDTCPDCLNPDKRTSNGFAVVKNANNFFYTFADVKAREGNYFALFDAASDGKAGKKAWKAQTVNNPNLKLDKNTTYLFSFWAANINNYGEMDNAAKLQFQIEYNGKTKKLGDVLDLGSAEFRNNRWHQCSATFQADEDATDVTISVINLNTNTLSTGNDFALDDIQFRAVSSPTHSVKIQEVITVQTHEPHIYSFTTTAQPMECDIKDYDVKLVVEYDNPKGNLVIKDLTADKEVFNAAVPTQNADWDVKKSKSLTIHIDALEPAVHEFKAYFADWTKAEAKASSTAPTFTMCSEIALTAEVQPIECRETSFDVKMTVDYVNPKGNLIIDDVTTGKRVFDEAVPAGELNEQMTKDDITIRINGLTPAEHTFRAYFAQLTATFAEAAITSPEYDECCVDNLMYSKWDDVLFINNHDSLFIAYQWYMNGSKLEGDTLQSLYKPSAPMAGTSDVYSCELTQKDGTKVMTCASTFDQCPSSAVEASKNDQPASIVVRPTRVVSGAAVTVYMTVEESVQATLLTPTGQVVGTHELIKEQTTIPMPVATGLYLLQLQGTNTQRTIKINVY